MTETLTEILEALPSTRTTVEDKPMVWRHPRSGTLLAGGGLLTGQQALAEAKAQHPNCCDFRLAGPVLSFKFVGRRNYVADIVHGTYVAEHPEPKDRHEAASTLESDLLSLGMSDEHAAALVHAVRTAIDGSNPGEQLRQWLAAWVRA